MKKRFVSILILRNDEKICTWTVTLLYFYLRELDIKAKDQIDLSGYRAIYWNAIHLFYIESPRYD